MPLRTKESEFIQSAVDDAEFTPDAATLFKRNWHPLFVYGTLQKGMVRHSLLSSGVSLGPARTETSAFALLYQKFTKHPYPIALPAMLTSLGSATAGRRPIGAHIQGEAYLIPPDTLANLDFIESNGQVYRRIVSLIHVNAKHPYTVPCWMYVGIIEHWKPEIANNTLELCDLYARKKDPDFKYYVFTKKTLTDAINNLACPLS